MEITTPTKKKKRRTRKCLDEIRKRSFCTVSGNYSGHLRLGQPPRREKSKRIGETKPLKCITTNRLTINMFPKAIRSETITRPILEEIKQKSTCLFLSSVKSICIDSGSSKDLKIESFEQSNSAASNSFTPMFDTYQASPLQVANSVETLRNHLNKNPSTNIGINVYPPTMQTCQLSDVNHGHEAFLYEELMNEISSHLNKLASTLVKEDVMKNTRAHLQKLYNHSWSKENRFSMIDHEMDNKSKATTLQLVRFRNVPETGRNAPACFSPASRLALPGTSAVSPSSPHSTHTPLSPLSPLSPLTFTSMCTNVAQCTMYHTPQYKYFPHKLN